MKAWWFRIRRIVADVSVLVLAYALAFVVRFDWDVPREMVLRFAVTLPYVVAMQYFFLYAFGASSVSWRYISLRDAIRIFPPVLIAAVVLALVRTAFAVEDLLPQSSLRHGLIPWGIIAIDAMLAYFGILGARVLRRLAGERSETSKRKTPTTGQVRTLFVGAGSAGVLVLREVESRPDLGILPVGFIDDDPLKRGSVVNGQRVLGSTAELPQIAEKLGAQQVLITIANAPGASIRRIRDVCDAANLPTKIIPGLYEIVGGKVNLSRIRKVAIEDLLRRDPVALDESSISRVVQSKIVLVTGAGGSIGSELCRQICRFGPRLLVLVEHSENNLFYIHRELSESYPSVHTAPVVGDVCDAERLQTIFDEYRPQVVFHAAAHKHVPLMELNAGEAVKNNVFGTRTVADTSDRHGVEVFVMISTDKAVNAVSIMGATKRVAELYIQQLAFSSKTKFVAVRFGNVMGSAGSVIPIFQKQIENGGPVTVTHPEMQRYFMTIPEACQLVIQAAALGEGGEIFILDMGAPVKIVDLARDLITLSGLRPDEDVPIVFTGTRPGEKLFEELSTSNEQVDKTKHPSIYVAKSDSTRKRQQVDFDSLRTGALLTRPEIMMRLQAIMRSAPEGMLSSYAPPSPSDALPPRRRTENSLKN